MSVPPTGLIVVEASPLISFLKIARFDLLEALGARLVCTAQVCEEVVWFRQRVALEALLAQGRITSVDLTHPEDLQAFAHFVEVSPLGPGEASSILFAARERGRLVITDKKGIREATRRHVPCLTTEDVVVHAIHQGLMRVEEADALISLWATHREYPVQVTSFAERGKPSMG